MRTLILFSILFAGSLSHAWGGRGHATICETAPFLVQNKALKEFLAFRPHVMGHLCNVPDIYWKSLPPGTTPGGNESHYINPEGEGTTNKEASLDYSLFNKSKSKEHGSLWWRADQLMRMAALKKDILKEAAPPTNRAQEQDEKLPYNTGIYQWMVEIGVLGHFVGDASMPFHSSIDHDGYHADHGGIHSYYEDLSVGQFDGDLHTLVLKRARELARDPKMAKLLKGSTLERMRELSVMSSSQIAQVLKLDPILKKSMEAEVDGKKKKTPAERKSSEVGYVKFRSMIIDQLARSTLLLAKLWDESYESIGKPDLSKYRSYRYPFTPEFIPVDYLVNDKK